VEYTIEQIIDIQLLQSLQDQLNEIVPFPSALIDLNSRILTATAWQDICTLFHRKNPETEKCCQQSDLYIFDHLQEANPAVSYQCPLGLIDNAVPIIIEGKHIANFFTGQFFLEPPDLEFFRSQAAKYGFDQEEYLDAVKKVPVWNRNQLTKYLLFIKDFTESLARNGLSRLRDLERSMEVAESEARFRGIVENTQAGYFFVDKNGIIQDVNQSWIDMYKYGSREEVIGHHFVEIQQVDEVDEAIALVGRILANDPASLSGEFSRKCKDGSIGYHRFSARPVVIGNQLTGIEGFIIDTTDRHLAEIQRDMTQTRLESVFSQMIEAFALHEIILNEKGKPVNYRFLDANKAFERMTGLKVADIVGKTVKEILPGTEEVWIERYGQVALTGKPLTFESYHQELDRHYHVVAFSNQKNQFAVIFEDISERKRSEEQIRTLAYAIESVNECVSMTDMDNNILFVNEAFCRTYGYTKDELIGKSITMVRSKSEFFNRNDEILTNSLGGGWSSEIINRKKDGTEFPVHISTAVVRDEMEKPVALIGIAVDITERKKNEKELVDAKLKAEESDRLKSAFLANISHEIRTPMNSILGFSELLAEMVTDPVQIKYLNIILNGGSRLLNIINSVIDIAKIEAGEITIEQAEFEIDTLLNELYQLNARPGMHLEFRLDPPSEPHVRMISDKTRLFQIINNLINNAIKFTHKGRVNFGYRNDAGSIVFYVADTGIGISPEFADKVFNRFHKDDLNNQADYNGAGLGLAISKQLVVLLNGEIWFDSDLGKGTTFYVKIPLQ
jgi:PAS domain S-box-containing protein